jgi:hypothetical protein
VDEEDKKTFIYQEDGLPSQFFSSPHGRQNTLTTPVIEREDIPPVCQDSASGTEARSMYGDSQSASVAASASMSANMHRIVEDVERLVESDTYENPPNVPDQFAFLNDSGEMSTPSARMAAIFALPSNEKIAQPLPTPMAPPGLGPPIVNTAEALRASASQSYTPLHTLPSIPSIWNTSSPAPLRDGSSPRTPPGLGQPSSMNSMGINPNATGSPSQDQITNDLLRHNLMAQSQLSSSVDMSGSMPSWLPLSSSHPANSWGPDPRRLSYNVPSQPISSGLPTQSWGNDALNASSLPSGDGAFNSGFNGHRKSATQLGAIGQTPPCGQGG